MTRPSLVVKVCVLPRPSRDALQNVGDVFVRIAAEQADLGAVFQDLPQGLARPDDLRRHIVHAT